MPKNIIESAFFQSKRTMRWNGEHLVKHQVILADDPGSVQDCLKSGYFIMLNEDEAVEANRAFVEKQKALESTEETETAEDD